MRPRRAFTLIELLVVIAIIAILAVVVVLTLNPANLLAQARDANRVSDLHTISSAIGLYQEDIAGGSIGSSSVIYVSIPSASSTCGNLDLPTLPSGYTYHCSSSADYRKTNSSGWLPIDFQAISYGAPFGALPVDPVNQTSSGLYYTYETNGSQYALTAGAQSQKYQTICTTSSTYTGLCTAGNDTSLIPLNFYASSTSMTAVAAIPFGTLAFNVSTTIGNSSPSQTSTLTFSGTAGQTIAITFDNSSADTYPSNNQMGQIFAPSGSEIGQAYVGQGNSNGVIIANYTLPATGTYTLKFVPWNGYSGTGQSTVKLITYADTTGTIAFNASTTMSTTYAGQTDSRTFTITTSTTIAVTYDPGSSDTYPNNRSQIQIFDPSGNEMTWGYSGNGGSGVIASNLTLSTPGTYTLRLLTWNGYNGPGQVTVHMIQYTDNTGTIAFNASTTMSTTYLGQTDSLSFNFNGSTSTRLNVTYDPGPSDTYPNNRSQVQIFNPSGNEMTWGYSGNGGSGVITSNLGLSATGTYTLLLLPWNGYQGGGQVTVYMLQYTNNTGTIAFNASTTMSTTYLGQTDSLTFNGTASSTITVTYDPGPSDTYPNNRSMIQILDPSGNEMTWGYSGNGGSGVITSNLTLPTTGTYTLLLLPWNGYQGGGQVTVKLTSP
jgi:prepilin-type N-terminal cleavage/methylation domain-containing protein